MSTHPSVPGRTRAISVSVDSVSARSLRVAGEEAGPFILIELRMAKAKLLRGAMLTVSQAIELHADLGRHLADATAELAHLGHRGDSKLLGPAARKPGAVIKKRGRSIRRDGLKQKSRRGGRQRSTHNPPTLKPWTAFARRSSE